jgi:ABC-2 type transport system permease protein
MSLLRLGKVYLGFLRFSFLRASEFRVDSLFRVAMDLSFYVQVWALFEIYFGVTDSMMGWSREQVLFFMSWLFLQDAIFMVLLDKNLDDFGRLVHSGNFDYYLVRPVPTLFLVGTRQIGVASILNVLFALTLFIYCSPLSLTGWNLLCISLLITAAVVLQFFSKLLFLLPAFWGSSAFAFLPLYWSLQLLAERPIHTYPRPIAWVLTYIFPQALIASLPVALAFAGFPLKGVAACLAATTLFCSITIFLWSWAIRRYSSASS